MSKPSKWWLISDQDVQVIKDALSLIFPTRRIRKNALHTLESGLHKTDEIPEDWRNPDE